MGLVEIVAVGFKFFGTILGSVLFIGSQGNWFSERFRDDKVLHRLLGLMAITSALIGAYLWAEIYYPIPKLEPTIGKWIGQTQSQAAINLPTVHKTLANALSLKSRIEEPEANAKKDEEDAWASTILTDSENAYRVFVNRFPRSHYASIARERIAARHKVQSNPSIIPDDTEPSPFLATSSGETQRSQSYPFTIFVPSGWSWDGTPNETSGDLATIRSSHFAYDHIACNVAKEDASQLSNLSQNELNAAVARGEAEGVLAKPFPLLGVTAQSDFHAIINLGDFVGQEAEFTAIKDGYKSRLMRMVLVTPGRAYYVNCVAPATMYDDIRPTFQAIVQSFRIVPS